MNNLSHLNKYFWQYKKLFGLGILFIIITNLFQVYSPRVVQLALDMIVQINSTKPGEVPGIFTEIQNDLKIDFRSYFDFSTKESKTKAVISMAAIMAGLYLLIYILKGVFLFFTRQTLIVMSRYIEFDLKNEIFAKYQVLDTAFYKQNSTGDLMNRISEDVSKVRMYLGPGVMYTVNLVILSVLTVWFMWRENAELTLYVLAPLPLMSIAIYYVSSMINSRSNSVQKQQSHLSTLAQEAFSGIRVLKAYNRENSFRNNFIAESSEYKGRQLALVKVDALFIPIMTLLIGLSTTLAIYIGGLRTIENQITVGQIAEFIMYVNMLTWPFAAIGWVTSINQQASASMQRINEFLHFEPQIKNRTMETTPIEGNIRFNNVSFKYPNEGSEALKDVSFEIKAGKTLAIVGRTGSGKSTIASLLTRQYDVQEGQILIDNKAIDQHNLYQLRTSIGYVPQETFLFSDNISNNIAFGLKEGATEERVIEASSNAQLHDNVLSFRDGYNTMLGERGITLSGGQKQRVAIARAIIKDPEILIFDDCLSAVDTETEEKILSNLRKIMKGKTTVLISHRISTVRAADNILVLDKGKIIEHGTHMELMQNESVYFELYKKQLLEERKLEG